MKLRTSLATTIIAAATLSLSACGSDDENGAIKIGTTDAGQQQWKVFEEQAKKEGLNVEIVSFNDYSLPNRALQDGQIDVNNFQHLLFLADYNVKTNSNLTPIGATEILPIAVYYEGHSQLSDIEQAGEVAVPNDPTNQGRALNMLADKGLITLKNKDLLSPTPADVDEGASKVKITPVDAAQTVTAYKDGTPAVINNSFLDRGNIDPASAIAQDDPNAPSAQPFINAFVTTEDHKNDENLLKLVDVWHSEEVQNAIKEQSKGSSISVTMGGEELSKILNSTQEKIRQQNS